MSSFPLTTGRLSSYFFCFIQLISPIKNANHFVFLISHAAIIGPAKLLMSPTVTWIIAFSMPAFSKTALIDAANKEQGNMKIVDGRFEPFIYAIRLQNAGLYHALEKMPQYNKHAGDDFYIINPFFLAVLWFFIYFAPVCLAMSASTISSPVRCLS